MPFPHARLGLILFCLATFPLLGASPAPARERIWRKATFTWVKLVPREPGSPSNDHPAAFAFDPLADQLGAIRVRVKAGTDPLFSTDEMKVFLDPLQQAFAAAGPDDDVELVSTYRRSGTALTLPRAATVRLFHQDGALQVIVHDARMDFLLPYYNSNVKPAFVIGSRTAPGQVQLQCPGAASRRPDWLAIPDALLAPASPAVPAPAAAPAPVAVPVPPPPPPAPAAPAPAAVPAPPPAPTAAPAPPAPAQAPAPRPARDPAYYQQQEERLRALKHLREENLITEEEYQQKRKAILDEI
jgi:hypothetical protein